MTNLLSNKIASNYKSCHAEKRIYGKLFVFRLIQQLNFQRVIEKRIFHWSYHPDDGDIYARKIHPFKVAVERLQPFFI
ncbi:MAG: hypothetical protein D8M58_11740 [Calditrichaeota bacterium]|nr:MAG: hypothetical protein DWQ03_12525 [Calditrichota bacterium]MBL1206067.1 hypothetical protein [Calditrichota bacterium]